eukprot:gene7731-8542_t
MFASFSNHLFRSPVVSTISGLLSQRSTFNLQQVATFSKYISNSRAKRLPLTTKRAGKGFYKGNRGRKEGRLTSKGRFIMIPEKCTELVVPDLTGFTLKPYIAVGAKRNLREEIVKL